MDLNLVRTPCKHLMKEFNQHTHTAVTIITTVAAAAAAAFCGIFLLVANGLSHLKGLLGRKNIPRLRSKP